MSGWQAVCGNDAEDPSSPPAIDAFKTLASVYGNSVAVSYSIIANDTVLLSLDTYRVATATFAIEVAASDLTPDLKKLVASFATQMSPLHVATCLQ